MYSWKVAGWLSCSQSVNCIPTRWHQYLMFLWQTAGPKCLFWSLQFSCSIFTEHTSFLAALQTEVGQAKAGFAEKKKRKKKEGRTSPNAPLRSITKHWGMQTTSNWDYIVKFTDKMSSFSVKMRTDTRHDTATHTELLNTMMEWDGRWHTTLMRMTSPTDDSDRQTQQNVANPWPRNRCDGRHITHIWCWQMPPPMAVTDVGWRWWQWWWAEVHSEQQGRLTCFFLHCRLLVPVGHALSIHFITGRPPLSFSHCRGLLFHHWLWFWSVNTQSTHSHYGQHTAIVGLGLTN